MLALSKLFTLRDSIVFFLLLTLLLLQLSSIKAQDHRTTRTKQRVSVTINDDSLIQDNTASQEDPSRDIFLLPLDEIKAALDSLDGYSYVYPGFRALISQTGFQQVADNVRGLIEQYVSQIKLGEMVMVSISCQGACFQRCWLILLF